MFINGKKPNVSCARHFLAPVFKLESTNFHVVVPMIVISGHGVDIVMADQSSVAVMGLIPQTSISKKIQHDTLIIISIVSDNG